MATLREPTLRERRRKLGGLRKAERLSGVGRGTWSRAERGLLIPRWGTLTKMGHYLKLSPITVLRLIEQERDKRLAQLKNKEAEAS